MTRSPSPVTTLLVAALAGCATRELRKLLGAPHDRSAAGGVWAAQWIPGATRVGAYGDVAGSIRQVRIWRTGDAE